MTPSDDEIVAAAMDAGFAISTAYGQGANKLMPISDRETLGTLYRAAFAAGQRAGMEEAANISSWHAMSADACRDYAARDALYHAVDAIREAKS